jgi:hypothetical protein
MFSVMKERKKPEVQDEKKDRSVDFIFDNGGIDNRCDKLWS